MGAQVSQVSAYSFNASIQDSKNITQFNSELLCESKCEGNINNIFIVIENSTVGNINFVQQCNASTTCYQQNDIEIINTVQMTNTQTSDASASNEYKAGFIPFIGVAAADVYSKAKNWNLASSYIASYININMNCVATSINTISDVFVIIKDTETGDINFTQQSDATLSCQSINSAKVSNTVTLVNDQTATASSSNSVKGLGLIGLIVLLILAGGIFAFMKQQQNKKQGGQPATPTPFGGPAPFPPPPANPKIDINNKDKVI